MCVHVWACAFSNGGDDITRKVCKFLIIGIATVVRVWSQTTYMYLTKLFQVAHGANIRAQKDERIMHIPYAQRSTHSSHSVKLANMNICRTVFLHWNILQLWNVHELQTYFCVCIFTSCSNIAIHNLDKQSIAFVRILIPSVSRRSMEKCQNGITDRERQRKKIERLTKKKEKSNLTSEIAKEEKETRELTNTGIW